MPVRIGIALLAFIELLLVHWRMDRRRSKTSQAPLAPAPFAQDAGSIAPSLLPGCSVLSFREDLFHPQRSESRSQRQTRRQPAPSATWEWERMKLAAQLRATIEG